MLPLDAAQQIGASIQTAHQELLDSFYKDVNAADMSMKIRVINDYRDRIIGLRQQHWAAVYQVDQLTPFKPDFNAPVDLDPTNPAHAVALAVRFDLADTEKMLDALAGQNLIGRQIENLKKTAPIGVKGAINYALENSGVPSDKEKGGKDPLDKITDILMYLGLGALGIFGVGLFLRARGK